MKDGSYLFWYDNEKGFQSGFIVNRLLCNSNLLY